MGSTKKVMVAYGTRPEAIKLAPVIQLLRADSRFKTLIVSTGQHREMVNQVTDIFGFKPDIDLALMHKRQPLNRILSRSLKGLDHVLKQHKPDAILVQGDTSTAASAAIAGFNRRAKIIHLEAGLRSYDLSSPFPEEANRKIISAIATCHLTPTNQAKQNLLKEGIQEDTVTVTGNTVIDALQATADRDVDFSNPELVNALSSYRRHIIFTSHRRENLGTLADIGSALASLARRYSDIAFYVPMHMNPKIEKRLLPGIASLPNVFVTGPLPYDQFVHLMKRSDLIITDSGGIQEEAPSLGIPALLIRETTERPEAIASGAVKLIGSNPYSIARATVELLEDQVAYNAMKKASNPYGDGRAAERTVQVLAKLFGLSTESTITEFDPTL
ncbi:non-hydrolyzing UDP-N-acetylglucosamine 2-epimerase [Corynebacterium coyleae]|uniref:non-hydrolyzing UDP-N-acetylglucosamine 2-epimerase n=1 Tax=Corynebacterium coyleae TaxID=53374 RepID=UPI00254BED04|nr:UDP-N-acetylglucosamine 2-epimerase (non-hydrolyzing) [Corynebacterium coyleae]MDK8823368.1 UDP-N-acetylglucosamine 2-epimerase (non-hydrolyzing) [Corynebacterium coyleae]